MTDARDDFEDVKILDNFYQTSCFYPMPVVLVSTLSPSGQTNLGPYSLCFPHVISGKHAMMLIARGNSNTAENIRRTGVAALNFIPDDRRFLENCVVLGFPGETTEEKMKDSVFTLVPSRRTGGTFPQLVGESVQVLECTWDASHPHEAGGLEHHYLLRIDRIVMHPRWHQALVEGGRFPPLPIDYGYRESVHFWFARARTPYSVDVPTGHGARPDAVLFDANRIDPDVTWEPEAAAMLANVPRVFLHTVLTSAVAAAKGRGLRVITPEFVTELRQKQGSATHPTLLQKLARVFSHAKGG